MVNNKGVNNMANATNVVEIVKSEKQLSMSPSAVRSRARRAATQALKDAKTTPQVGEAKVAKKAAKPRALPTAAPIKVSAAQKRTIGQFVAAIASGFLPIASFVIAHQEAASQPLLWILVAAALMFSAPSVASWANKWCGHQIKAWGFTVLLEGTLVFAHHEALSLGGLAILILVNASNAWQLAARREVQA
jgi:VIT1/CCC1 family predicted Fe2+/Mn2+ transporter